MKTVSASDLNKAAQRWISNNYVGKCTHLFPSFSDQLNSRNCSFHEGLRKEISDRLLGDRNAMPGMDTAEVRRQG